MVQLRLVATFGIVTLVTGCVTAPLPLALSPPEADAVCAMATDIVWHPFGTVSWEDDPEREARLLAIANEDELSPLPARIQCAEKQIILNDADGVPFHSFWVSQDGTQAAISGGWLGGELLGGGGICYFSMQENRWIRRGCIATWAA